MRALTSALLALACWVLCAGGARAGIYILSESPQVLPGPLDQIPVKQGLVAWRQMEDIDPNNHDIGDKKADPSPKRLTYLKLVADLEAKQTNGKLEPREIIDLSGWYLRLGRFEEARGLLERTKDTVKGDPSLFFLADLNLATAYALLGGDLLPKAVQHQEEALKNWPLTTAYWNPDVLAWYLRAEELVLRHLKARMRGPSGTGDLRLSEALFPAPPDRAALVGLRFGKGDKYTIGALPPEMAEFLPPDAVQLVLQLAYWSPRDPDLQWLYAELLNANHQVVDASVWMNLLIGQGVNSQILFQHRQQLLQRADSLSNIAVGKRLVEDIWNETHPQPDGDTPAPPPVPATSSWPPDWKTLIVGFLAGLLITTLGALQLREWNRRSGNTGALPTSPTPDATASSSPTQPLAETHIQGGSDDRGLRP